MKVNLYCEKLMFLSDKLPWMELMRRRKQQWTALDLTVDKSQAVSIGLTFKDVSYRIRQSLVLSLPQVSGCQHWTHIQRYKL